MATSPGDDGERLSLAPDLGIALMELGRFAEARETLNQAVTDAVAAGEDVLATRARLVRCFLGLYSGDAENWSETTATEIDAALPLLEGANDEVGLTLAWRLRSGLYGTAGRWADVAVAAVEVIEHATRAGDERAVTRAAISYATASVYGPTPVPEAIRECEELLERSTSDQLAAVLIRVQLAQLYAMRGEFARARELYAGTRAKLKDLDAGFAAARTSIGSSRVEFLAGDYATAERELRADYEALSGMGEGNFLFTVGGLLGRAVLAQGRDSEAEALAAGVRDTAPSDDTDAQALWRLVMAGVLARRSDPGAVALVEEAVSIRRTSDSPVDLMEALIDLADIHEESGLEPTSARALDEALELAERKGDVVTAARVRDRTLARARVPGPRG
jgi:tetratricopeptide (TPR) repeat protein